MKRLLLIFALLVLPLSTMAAPAVGEVLPTIELSGEAGGRVDGTAWSSDMLTGKVHVLFYADPDESETNNAAADAIKAAGFGQERFGSVAVVNMDATWLPNSVLDSAIEKKQKKFPNTVYVKDMKKTLVKKWGLADHSNDVLVFAPDGKLVFYKAGELDASEIEQMLETIRANLP